MDETLAEIEAQIDVAARGVSTHVTDRQTATGVKDNISQHWIKLLLERGGDLHARYLTNPETRDKRLNDKKLTRVARTIVRSEIETKILTEQREWLARQPQSSHRLQALLEEDNAGGKSINDTFFNMRKRQLTFRVCRASNHVATWRSLQRAVWF